MGTPAVLGLMENFEMRVAAQLGVLRGRRGLQDRGAGAAAGRGGYGTHSLQARYFARQVAAKKDRFDAISAEGLDIKASWAGKVDEMRRGFDGLLVRAKAAGAVRPDVSTDEILSLVSAACQSAGHTGANDASLQCLDEIVCIGIRVPATS